MPEQPQRNAKNAYLFATRCQADDDGAGFAHEILEFCGQWCMSGVVGRDGHFKLKFTPIEWTEDSLRLADDKSLPG